jgi:hypothetical protein
MSMTSHPVAFGTIEHTERAGELLGELVKANEALAREAHTWSKAAETYAASEANLADALTELVALEDMRLRLRELHEMGHGTDYDNYHKRLPLAWDAARAALGPNVRANRPWPQQE